MMKGSGEQHLYSVNQCTFLIAAVYIGKCKSVKLKGCEYKCHTNFALCNIGKSTKNVNGSSYVSAQKIEKKCQ